MNNKESHPQEIENNDYEKESENTLEDMGEFDRAAAEQSIADYKETHKEAQEKPDIFVKTEKQETPEARTEIDYSCFDELAAEDFDSLPEEKKKEILERCEAAYDAALEEFAKLGDFRDPEIGRYNGDVYHEGMDGAKRGVDYIVQCVFNAEYWQKEVDKIQAELDALKGLKGLFKKKEKLQIQRRLYDAQRELDRAKRWPEEMGKECFLSAEERRKIEAEYGGSIPTEKRTEAEDRMREASSAVFHSEAVQAKYQHLIQMKRLIRQKKYHVN